MNKNVPVVLFFLLAAGCSTGPRDEPKAPPMDAKRKVSEQECARPIDTGGGNLLCREVSEAELRARLEEQERQARARKEALERAERERKEALERAERERRERERAEQLAREEAARKAREAEEERLAAERRRAEEERRRLEAEAARKAQEERERKEARERAEREAREAALRECQRLEHERLEGRAALENFVGTYGTVDEFKGISGQIKAFLDKARKVKPCPPARRAGCSPIPRHPAPTAASSRTSSASRRRRTESRGTKRSPSRSTR